jgi:hypothetical protein
VVVVGTAMFDDIRQALTPVEQRLGISVNPVVVTPRRWALPGKDPFLATVRDRPLVEIPLSSGS